MVQTSHHVVQLQIPNSMVNPLTTSFCQSNSRLDTLVLSMNGNTTVPFLKTGIAWSTDKAVKFKNPDSAQTCKTKLKFDQMNFDFISM